MKKKFLILSLVIILILGMLPITAFADTKYSLNATMTANNSRVEAGSEVLIVVKLSQLNVPETGINDFTAYLGYDSNVFETINESSIDGVDGWKPEYTPGTTKIHLYRDTFLKTDGEIMQISLKTKEGLEDGTQGKVTLTTIIVSDGLNQINATNISATIMVGSESSGGSVGQPQTNSLIPLNTTPLIPENTAPTNNSTPVNNSTLLLPTTNNTSNTTNEIPVVNEADSDIPYTGSESGALARIIVGVIFISLVIYIKMERINKDMK